MYYNSVKHLIESGPFYQFDNELQIRTILLDSVFNHSHSLYI